MDAERELLETYAELERNYASFQDDGRSWKGDVAGLDSIVERRERSLERGAALMARIRDLWPGWEASSPCEDARSRVFQARNRLVEMGLSVSKADTALQTKVRRRTEELRRSAADTSRQNKASMAYRKGRAGL